MRVRKIVIMAVALFTIIASICIATSPTKGGIAVAATSALVVGGVTLEGKEEAIYNAILDAVKSEVGKFHKGDITETKLKENVALALKEYKYDIASDEKFKKFSEDFNAICLKVKAMEEVPKGNQSFKTLGQQFAEAVKSAPDNFKAFCEHKSDSFSLDLKSATIMLNSTNVTGGYVPVEAREPGMTDVAVERRFIMNVIGATTTTSPTISYVQKVNKDGTVAFVLDTEAYAPIDFDLDVDVSSAKDVGAITTVHENMIADIDFLAGEIDRNLTYEVMKEADAEVIAGVGTTSHLKGITQSAAAFSLTTLKVKTPNVGDAISACIAQIATVGFDNANFIAMHDVDYYNLIGAKDANGRYVGHPLLSADGKNFAGIPITLSTQISQGYLLVGNKMKSNIKILRGITIAMGYNLTGEFAKQLITIRGGMRLHHYIKTNEANSFVYDAIDDIYAAIAEDIS